MAPLPPAPIPGRPAPAQVPGQQNGPDGWFGFAQPQPASVVNEAGLTGTRSRRSIAVTIGLVLVGALVGALVTVAFKGSSSGTFAQGVGGQGSGQFGNRQFGPGATSTVDAISGTLTKVEASSITLRTATASGTSGTAGTSTFLVTGSTRIFSGTSAVALSTLKVGDPVTVTPTASGSGTGSASTTPTAATITVGASSGASGGTPPTGAGTNGGPGLPPGQAPTGTGTSSTANGN